MSNESLLIVVLALPFAGSLAAGLFPANARNREAWLAGAVALAVQALAWAAYPEMANGQVLRLDFAWLPALGLNFTIRLDGFAWMFAILVSGIGFLVVLYARYYLSPADPVPRFFSFFLAFMGSMLGVVLAGDLIQLVFFWELTSFFSFLPV
ncbi:MAG TPA: monovalent cation/H+ antiporter subunit A, partial [Burkholderiales bacterium]|nr:monovalent cation/H+ antiporter subunit A [Burkholderiales bacterium]